MSGKSFFLEMEERGRGQGASDRSLGTPKSAKGIGPPPPPIMRFRQDSMRDYITPEDEQGIELLVAELHQQAADAEARRRAEETGEPYLGKSVGGESSSSLYGQTPSGLASGRKWLSLSGQGVNGSEARAMKSQQGLVRTLTLPKDGDKLATEMTVKDLLRYIQNAVRRAQVKEGSGTGFMGERVVMGARPPPLVSLGKHTPGNAAAAKAGGSKPPLSSSTLSHPIVERSRSVGGHTGGMLNARDVRRLITGLDSETSKNKDMSFAVRRHTVVLNLDELRCLVLWDRLIVVIPEGADSHCFTKLEENLNWLRAQKRAFMIGDYEEEEFEFLALEAVLMTIVGSFQSKLNYLRPRITKLTKALLGPHSVSALHQDQLRQLKNRVSSYQSKGKSLHKAIMELLDDENDVRHLHLTRLARHRLSQPSDASEEIKEPIIDDDETQDLLESYLGDVQEITTKWELVKEDMQNTEEYVLMKLDMARNKLLTLGAVFDLVNVSFAFGNLVAAIFGMNLLNGISSTSGDPGTYDDFLWTTCVVGFMMLSAIVLTLIWMWKRGILVY